MLQHLATPGAPAAAPLDRRLCVAPMMGCTDRHDRMLLRLVTRCTLLYTEMVVASALLRGDAARLLEHHPDERPLALQVGGSDPFTMGRCARLAEDAGFQEVNVNVGCPSPRVQAGRFGACMLTEPARIAECVAAMRARTTLPVTVKTRTGVDDRDDYETLARFVELVATAGCEVFVVHARKALLAGLSPKANRAVPALDHPRVARLKRDFPHLAVVLNGGVCDLDAALGHLDTFDGVMIGRAAYHDPFILAGADWKVFGRPTETRDRHAVAEAYLPYVARQVEAGAPLGHLTRHLMGLFHGRPGARGWRRALGAIAARSGAGADALRAALATVPR